MTKILNIEDLSTGSAAREIHIGGASHPIQEMNVGDFIETTKDVERMMKEGAGLAEQMEATIRMITRCVPSLTKDALASYKLSTLAKIAAFVRGEDVEGTQAAPAAEGAQGK